MIKSAVISIIGILLAVIGSSAVWAQANTNSNTTKCPSRYGLAIKADCLGPAIWLANRDYGRVSAEMEFTASRIPKYTLSFEGGYFSTVTRFDTVWGVEKGKAARTVAIQSFLVGLRRYFGGDSEQFPSGPFLEIQTGYEKIRVDTSLNFLTFSPALFNFSVRSRMALRLKGGWQVILWDRLLISPCVSFNVWGLFEWDGWFRIFEPKPNLRVKF